MASFTLERVMERLKRGVVVSVWVQNDGLHRYNYLFYCAATGGQTLDMISLR